MIAGFSIKSKNQKLVGATPPPIPFGRNGLPLLPYKGDVVMVNGIVLVVSGIIWFPALEIDDLQIVVNLDDPITMTNELTNAAHVARALREVLADREAELLELKGPCSNKKCKLHYAHSGPCNIAFLEKT